MVPAVLWVRELGSSVGLRAISGLVLRRRARFEPVAADRPAPITTTPLPCSGGPLRLSADVSGSGAIRVTLLDENNKALAVSEPLTGSATDAELKWPGGFSLAELAGNRIRLKFELRAAKLYSFIL